MTPTNGLNFSPDAQDLSMDNARVLGQAAAVAYEKEDACRQWAMSLGFDEDFDFFSGADTQGFVAQNALAVVVAFRGTEPTRRADWLSDIEAVHSTWDHSKGLVHKGFYKALKAVWDQPLNGKRILPERLLERGSRTVWITGHSLGGALAELCAAQAFLVRKIPIQGVYTFGQPRVGNADFCDEVHPALGSRIFRFVNDRDIVPRVPLFSMRYQHYGSEIFFDKDKNLSRGSAVVEDFRAALKIVRRAMDLDRLREGTRGLILELGKAVLRPGGPPTELLKRIEDAIHNHARELLARGTENITDHDMRKGYLACLGTALQ